MSCKTCLLNGPLTDRYPLATACVNGPEECWERQLEMGSDLESHFRSHRVKACHVLYGTYNSCVEGTLQHTCTFFLTASFTRHKSLSTVSCLRWNQHRTAFLISLCTSLNHVTWLFAPVSLLVNEHEHLSHILHLIHCLAFVFCCCHVMIYSPCMSICLEIVQGNFLVNFYV